MFICIQTLLKLVFKEALRSRLCIQLICIFQQYGYNLNNQFIFAPKFYNFDKNNRDLVWHILLTVCKWGSGSHDTEIQALIYSMRCNSLHSLYRGIVTKYCQYELVNFADKLHILYNILNSFQTGFCHILNDKDSDYKLENKQIKKEQILS